MKNECVSDICYVCNRRRDGEPGWETEEVSGFGLCPKHRKNPAITTLGEMIAEKAAITDRSQ